MTNSPLLPHTFIENENCETVLYLHGFMGCREDWNEVVDRIGDRFSHLLVDLPGHGREWAERRDCRNDVFTIPGCARLIADLLDSLQLETCHLVGYSMGGRLALYLPIHYRDRFIRVVIESASPGLATEDERAARRNSDDALAARLESEPLDSFLDSWYRQPLFATLDQATPRFHDLLERRLQSDPHGLARSLRLTGTGSQPSLWQDLGRITAPLLFLTGELDAKFTALARRMAPLCRSAATAIIPRAGHNVHFERPAAYSDKVKGFLTG